MHSDISPNQLKELLKEKGIKQKELEGLLSLSQPQISLVMSGRRKISNAEQKLLKFYFYGENPFEELGQKGNTPQITRQSIRRWLLETGHSQKWLAESLNVSSQAVSNWLRPKNPQNISSRAANAIYALMETDRAKSDFGAKMPLQIVLDFSEEEFSILEQEALDKKQTLRDWAKTQFSTLLKEKAQA